MIPVLSRAQMRAFDAHAIDACKVPSLVLMENAGRGAAEAIAREILGGRAAGARVVVVCGAGNNGGDGFVVARRLMTLGARVEAWLAGDPARLTPDCRANHDAFTGIGGRVLAGDAGALAAALGDVDVVVDALFGTGLDRAIEGRLADMVRAMNAAAAPKAALDVPSGMDADTGATLGVAVEAALTVTFAHLKLGHVTPNGARLSGAVFVSDIGVPASLRGEHAASVVEACDVREGLAARAVDAHKYRAGHVAVVAGSAGKVGASLLAARGALRGGAGAATIVTWAAAAASLESRVVEVMTARIGEGDAASDDDAVALPALGAELDRALANKRAVVVGPGFGTSDRARAAVRHVLGSYAGPVVVDADAITVHAGRAEELASAAGAVILTPHEGELGRLLGVSSAEVGADRFAAARAAAAKARAVVLLKGAHTVVAEPGGRVVVIASGNPALATAGSGDVLSGLCAALACAAPPFEAAYAAAHLHGAAGDAWRRAHGDRGLLAGEIADALPDVIREVREGR